MKARTQVTNRVGVRRHEGGTQLLQRRAGDDVFISEVK
jgi:hypothetical protein